MQVCDLCNRIFAAWLRYGVSWWHNKEQEGVIKMTKKIEVPVWERFTITIEEAAQYFGIGTSKLRELSNEDNCPFVLWVGNKRLIKRWKLEEYLTELKSI